MKLFAMPGFVLDSILAVLTDLYIPGVTLSAYRSTWEAISYDYISKNSENV